MTSNNFLQTDCYIDMTNKQKRLESLLPNGMPKYVRCYDNGGETADRYTVVFTGNYTHKTDRHHWYIGMSANPFHPLGIGCFGESRTQIDRPAYSHLGKKIKFEDLPKDCKKNTLEYYTQLWDLEIEN